MNDRRVSLSSIVSAALWALTFAFIVVGIVVGVTWHYETAANGLMNLGLAFSAMSATATIRSYFCRQNRLLRMALDSQDDAPVTRLQQVR